MSWGICVFKLVLLVTLWKGGHCGREQQVLAPKYIVSGESVELPCTLPANHDLLKWKFQANGSNIVVDVAMYFPGGLTTIFGQFDHPPARSTLIGGSLTITKVVVPDEGQYWCEIVQPGEPTLLSDKHPIVVWVTPRTPTIISEGNGTVLEYTKTSVARCSSSGGKPVSQLSWWNGSEPLPSSAVPVVSKNPFSDKLWDVTLDLVLEYPTRFDHKRKFTCLVEHPAYKGTPKSRNHSVKVLYKNICAPCGTELQLDTLHDNYCASEFVLKVKAKKVKTKKGKGVRELVANRKRRVIYKTGPLSRRDLKRMKLIVRGTRKCTCPPLDSKPSSNSKKQRKEKKGKRNKAFYLVMGRKYGKKLLVTVLHSWPRKNKILKQAHKTNFNARDCPAFGNTNMP